MASSNTDSPGTIYRWIERKPLTEAVSWTSREKFWLITAACHYGTHDWKSVAQVVRNAGEPYRPREWYTPKSCERQFKILVSNLSKEVKSLPLIDMLQHIAEGLKSDYLRDAIKSKDSLKSKYCSLFSVLNRVKQGNLSRNEVVSLYSQARRNEIEGKQYMDQLMTRQNASLASENSSSGLIEEQPIKWNTPSAPLLTSLLRSRNTIPANRTATTIASLLQSPGGTSRTRSGKLLPLTPSISRTTQGTPTLSKLLEAPANPYIPSPPQSTQKNKLSDVGTEKLANTSKKENSQSTSLNRVRVDTFTTLGSFNQINKSDLSASKRQISKSPVSAVKNGSKGNSSVVSLLSDSEPDDDTKNTSLKSLYGDKKDSSSRLEPRATRSQTRAEGGFKQLNDTKPSDGKKERENLKQQSGGSQMNETHLIDEELIDIDQIEVEPLSSVQDELQTPSKMTRSSLQKLRLLSPGDNLLTNNKINSKEISNKMLEERSANFVLNSPARTLAPEYKCLLGKPNNSDSAECLIPVDRSACKDAIMIRKDSQTLTNTLTTLKQKGVIEIKAANIRRIDSRNDSKFLSYNNQPIVVVNKIKKPFNIKLASEQRNKTDNIQVPNTDMKKPIRLNNSSQNVVKLIDSSCSLADDEVIIIDDDVNINDDNMTSVKISEAESKNLPSTAVSSNIPSNSKSTVLQLDEQKNRNDKTPWNMFGKTQNILDTTKKQCHQDSVSRSRTNSNINETNNRFIKELDFDFDQSISQTSLSELYNGVEEIVEMHSFDNEELNSLIECGSLDSNETEERIDIVGTDQGDSSVSESDSTIGAFDTFAQITRVRQKSFTSKNIKLDSKESKTTNQRVKHLKENFCHSVEIDDDQSSAVSVTGIPVLQGVISDVMSQIDLGCVASLKTINPHNVPITDVVEISSDEEVTVDVPIVHPLNVQQIQNKEKEVKSYKLKEDKLIKIHEIENKMYEEVNINHGTNTTINPINIEMPPCIIVNHAPDANILTCEKILEIKKEMAQEYDDHDFEMMTFIPNTDNLSNENESQEAEVIIPKEITVTIANEKLLKEAERMKKEVEERRKKEERKKIEDERKKHEENERKKKEDVERMKKEDEEKKEEDRRKREHEKMLLNELYIKKKREEEERKCKEDYERKKKEDERKKKEDERKKKEDERKLKELQEQIKMEEEQKRQEKNDEEERARKETDKRLKEYHEMLKKELEADMKNKMQMRVVVKEEIIDECIDDILDEIIDEDIIEEDFFINDDYYDEIFGRIMADDKGKDTSSHRSRSELDEVRDLEYELMEKSFQRRILIKNCKYNENFHSSNDAKLRKSISVKETELKGLDKRSTLKKVKEPENHRYVGHTEVNLVKNHGVSSVNFKKKSEHVQNNTNIELALIETRKVPAKVDFETSNPREHGLRKCIEPKGMKKKSTEVKMVTRTRGLKIEEKIKESNVSKNVSSKLRPLIKSYGSSPSGAGSASVENPSVSTNEYKKQFKNTDDGNKCKSTSNVYDIRANRDLNVNSSDIVRTDNLNHKVIEIPRTRSRSSSFKRPISETRSSKQNQDNCAAAIIPKETVGTKTVLTSTHPNHQITKPESPQKNFDSAMKNFKILCVPLVSFSTRTAQLKKLLEEQSAELKEQQQIQPKTPNQIQKQTVTSTELEKPPPKKRGRKRLIDIQNDKLQESKSIDKTTSQSAAKTNTSIQEVEPLAKRTRRSLGLRCCTTEPVNKQSNHTQPRSATVHVNPSECTKEFSNKSNKNNQKSVMKYVYGNLCENKYISTLNKEVRGLSPESTVIIKWFSKETVVDVLLGLITNIGYSTKRGLPIPPILQLLTALRFYASSNFQIVSGDIRGINQATVSRIIKRVSMSLASQFNNYVNFPNTAEEWRLIQEQFYKMYKMPGIGGCIDCTHIKIQNPGGPDGEVFRNRKRYFSLNVQAICGPSMEFLDVVVRWPGSYHDSFIFNGSYANRFFSENTNGVKLLGDGGYACKSYLFTPLRNPTTVPERPVQQSSNQN